MLSKKNRDKRNESEQPQLDREVSDLVGQLGKVINSAMLYGESHRMTTVAYDETYEKLNGLLAGRAKIRLSLFEDRLHVDGHPMDRGGALVQVVARQMKKLDVSGFALLKGMSREEFGNLMQLLSAREASDSEHFKEELKNLGLQHVESEGKGELTRVGDDETVVSRREAAEHAASGEMGGGRKAQNDDLEKDSEAFMRDLAARMKGTSADNAPARKSGATGAADGKDQGGTGRGPDVEKILAFLKGSDSLSSIPSSDELQKIASDSEKLANLIMESATVQMRDQNLATGESLADLVIGALRRTYNGLRRPVSDPKRQIDARKSLLMLEKSVLDRLHKMMEGVDKVEAQVDADVVEEVDEVEVATMTAEYVRRRKSLERMEQEVMRYIKGNPARAQDGERLQTAFQEAGMSAAGWRELVAKSGTGESGGGDGGGTGAGGADLGALTMLLSQLDRLMDGEPPDPKSVGETVKEVGGQVSRLSESTKDKMDELGKTLDDAETAVQQAREAGKTSPEKLAGRELLAEIVQELCQPATAISCSAMMLLEGMFGALPPDQADVLRTVSDCGDKLNRLLEHLKNIVGYPSDFVPKHDQV